MHSVILKIYNMYCTSCEERIKRILCTVDGIKSYRTNLFLREIYIEYEKAYFLSEIKKMLAVSGFKLELPKRTSRYLFTIGLVFYAAQRITAFYNFYSLEILFPLLIHIFYYKDFVTSTSRLFLDTAFVASSICLSLSLITKLINTASNVNKKEGQSRNDEHSGIFSESASTILLFRLAGKALVEWIGNRSVFYLYSTSSEHQLGAEYKIGACYPLDKDIPFDGTVQSGSALVNEANLTGESFPVHKNAGSSVFCGTRIVDGRLTVLATTIGKNTKIGILLQKISRVKFPENKRIVLFERFLLLFFLTVFLIWFVLGLLNVRPQLLYPMDKTIEKAAHEGRNPSLNPSITFLLSKNSLFLLLKRTAGMANYILCAFRTALIVAMNTLVVACPCVFSIAEPLLFLRVSQILFQNGILVKNLEFMKDCISHVYIDKTGTLTDRIEADALYLFDSMPFTRNKASGDKEGIKNAIYSILFKMEEHSKHPIGLAIREFSKEMNDSSNNLKGAADEIQIENIREIVSNGVIADSPFGIIKLGKKDFVAPFSNASQIDLNPKYINIYCSINGVIVAGIEIKQRIRRYARELIEYFKREKYDIEMLTGDSKENAESISSALKLEKYFYSFSSEDKLSRIKRNSIFIGDGANDAAAMVKAKCGISVNRENDSSNIVILDGDLKKVVFLFKVLKMQREECVSTVF
ncbi:P-type Cu+ transporter [Enteropsectra breve]|nr:P-type Cu+ transporter [Enteropsectra breve]